MVGLTAKVLRQEERLGWVRFRQEAVNFGRVTGSFVHVNTLPCNSAGVNEALSAV